MRRRVYRSSHAPDSSVIRSTPLSVESGSPAAARMAGITPVPLTLATRVMSSSSADAPSSTSSTVVSHSSTAQLSGSMLRPCRLPPDADPASNRRISSAAWGIASSMKPAPVTSSPTRVMVSMVPICGALAIRSTCWSPSTR